MSYKAAGTRAIAATQSALSVAGGTAVVIRAQKVKFGTSGTPTSDQAVNAQLRRLTAAGTGTSLTPQVASPGSYPASEATVLVNLSAEPTYSTVACLDEYFNPRSPMVWQAYDVAGELLVPLTANNGLGAQCIAIGGGAGNFTAQMEWGE
jgi:hypothetical protein